MPELIRWSKVISHFLKPGGIFYIRDDHPVAVMIDDNLKASRNYFHEEKPIIDKPRGSYAYSNDDPIITTESCEWHHGMSDIIGSLLRAGLTLDFFHEFPYTGFERYKKLMFQDSDGWFKFKDKNIKIPLMFSLKATK